MSGDVAREYLLTHLRQDREDGLGRPVHRCEDTQIEWVEDRDADGYASDVTVLRRLAG